MIWGLFMSKNGINRPKRRKYGISVKGANIAKNMEKYGKIFCYS
jgi:hypothetical protein